MLNNGVIILSDNYTLSLPVGSLVIC